MTEFEFHKQLIDRFVDNTASSEELEALDLLMREGKLDQLLMQHMEVSWAEGEQSFRIAETEQAVSPGRNVPLWRRYRRTIAAAAVAAITVGIWLYLSGGILNRRTSEGMYQVPNAIAMKYDIAPGKNTATLTVAKGKVINLDTNKSSVVVADSVKTTTMLTASTPRGGTYRFVLSDGTKVWLNAASYIQFPARFTGKERRIILGGEAYMEVTKDNAHPFMVESKGQAVQVLGTHFNISAYADERAVKTTLLEGSVKVSPLGLSEVGMAESAGMTILKPGQQSILRDQRIDVNAVDVQETIAWKDGYFRFNNESIENVMRKLSRWYNVDIQYEGTIPKVAFTGKLSRNNNVSQILKALESTKKIQFKIEGRKIIVKP